MLDDVGQSGVGFCNFFNILTYLSLKHGTREDCVTPIVESGNKSFDRAFSKSNGEF